jgi:hypothetical protein
MKASREDKGEKQRENWGCKEFGSKGQFLPHLFCVICLDKDKYIYTAFLPLCFYSGINLKFLVAYYTDIKMLINQPPPPLSPPPFLPSFSPGILQYFCAYWTKTLGNW